MAESLRSLTIIYVNFFSIVTLRRSEKNKNKMFHTSQLSIKNFHSQNDIFQRHTDKLRSMIKYLSICQDLISRLERSKATILLPTKNDVDTTYYCFLKAIKPYNWQLQSISTRFIQVVICNLISIYSSCQIKTNIIDSL